MSESAWIAFGLTLFAGLSTGLGGLMAILTRATSKKFLSAALGFSGGVMIYVSFAEILKKASLSLSEAMGENGGAWATVLAFFGGMVLILVIDRLIPAIENPHEPLLIEDGARKNREGKLMRMGLLTALAIAIHNFPEGLATFAAALYDPAVGASIALAIALHNIPEGIAVAVPIHAATGSRAQALLHSFLSGLAEPLGALAGYFLLRSLFSPFTFGLLFAAVAGIMVFISLDELIPTAREYDTGHVSIYGVTGGMAAMAVSLLLFL
ncbi:MAG: zinc transporter ZupT [Anaerolineales bacterium]|nr:zinc transporter ZupT [Anaerolineales bacterium]MCX7756364.1 zinc transporter ZupT [Anaerolineales bacterium]MDW8276698.1 zinc transporter ZupT [Anaerolineales bacterium]